MLYVMPEPRWFPTKIHPQGEVHVASVAIKAIVVLKPLDSPTAYGGFPFAFS